MPNAQAYSPSWLADHILRVCYHYQPILIYLWPEGEKTPVLTLFEYSFGFYRHKIQSSILFNWVSFVLYILTLFCFCEHYLIWLYFTPIILTPPNVILMQILYDSILLSTKPKAALHYLDFVGSSWETLIQKNILQNILHTRIYANLKLRLNSLDFRSFPFYFKINDSRMCWI